MSWLGRILLAITASATILVATWSAVTRATTISQNAPVAAPSTEASGGTYHNGVLGFTYPYPKGWTSATPAEIAAANAKIKATPPPAPQPGQPHTNTAAYAELLFYAHGAGKDDGTFRGVPSVKITSLESVGAMLNVDVMKRDSGDIVKTGLTSVRDPEKLSVSGASVQAAKAIMAALSPVWRGSAARNGIRVFCAASPSAERASSGPTTRLA